MQKKSVRRLKQGLMANAIQIAAPLFRLLFLAPLVIVFVEKDDSDFCSNRLTCAI